MPAWLRVLHLVAAALWLVVGVVLFTNPGWARDEFAWKVSSFVAMTIGAWSIGTAIFAAAVARNGRWSTVYAASLYVWAFGIGESIVLVVHRDRLVDDTPLALAYIAALATTLLAAALGLVWLLTTRPQWVDDDDPPAAPSGVIATRAFVVLVTIIALAVLDASERARTGRVFPEPLSTFSLGAFGAFFGALVVGALPLALLKRNPPLLVFGLAGLGLIVPITIAAFVYFERFDFGDRPLTSLYLIAYLGVGIATAAALWPQRREVTALFR
jgi:hypothetical protein